MIDDILAHARAEYPRECCGVVISAHRKERYIPCRNDSLEQDNFQINAADYASAEDQGQITAIVHSHPTTRPEPTQADLIGIERSGLPWIIVNPLTGEHTRTEPSGYVPPLIGRPFVHAVTDCYGLIRDYYATQGLMLADYEREHEWWLHGADLYEQNLEVAGFVTVDDGPQLHDMILMQVASPVINHGGVYVGDGAILHHVAGKLSSRDIYGGYWRKITRKIVRHRHFIK